MWHQDPANTTQVRIRREIVQRALAESSPILSRPETDSGESESVLCVPLVGVETNIGVIYLSATGRLASLKIVMFGF